MSRAVRFAPLALLLVLLAGLVWRLAKPSDSTVASKLEGKPAPAFDLGPGLEGKPALSSRDLATGQPRIVNIFASWCVPCVGEAPVLDQLRQRGIEIDAIAVRDTPAAVSRFLRAHGDPYARIGADPQSEAQIALGSSGVPETYVIDGQGVIRHQYIGPLTAANVPGVIKQLEELR